MNGVGVGVGVGVGERRQLAMRRARPIKTNARTSLDVPREWVMTAKRQQRETDNPHYNPALSFGYDLGHS